MVLPPYILDLSFYYLGVLADLTTSIISLSAFSKMKTSKTDQFIFVGLLMMALLILLSTIGQSTIDIQLYDTYFVLDRMSLVILIIGPLTLLVYFARAMTTKFRTRWTNIGAIIGLFLVALITFQIIQFQESDLKEMMSRNDEGLPDRGEFVVNAKQNINRTRGILVFWILGSILLIVRTIKIWKKTPSPIE